MLRLYRLLGSSWHVELYLFALLFQKLLKFLLANGLGQSSRIGLDRSIPLLGVALPESKTIMYLQMFSLDDLAYSPIDDFIPAVDQLGLDEGLPVLFAGEEVLQMSVDQSFVAQLFAFEGLDSELPSSLHIRTIIIFRG